MVQIDKWAFLWWAVLLLALPLQWVLAALGAACVHELFHLLAVWMSGGEVRCIRLGPFGAVIEAGNILGVREIVCILAGPAGSLTLLLLMHRVPLLAFCGIIQGCFNLLPVYPLDGGCALRCFLDWALPERAEILAERLEFGTYLALLMVPLMVSVLFDRKNILIWLAVGLATVTLLRKKP